MTLDSPHGVLWPYERGRYPRDTLYLLWRMIEEEHVADKLFFGQTVDPGHAGVRGDLAAFCDMFSDPRRRLLIAQAPGDNGTSGALMGLIWFDDVIPQHRASVNIFMRRRYWGVPARDLAGLALRYIFEAEGLQHVWAYTPWPLAIRMAEAVGFRQVAVLPEFLAVDGAVHDVTILRVTPHELRADSGPSRSRSRVRRELADQR